VVLPLALGDFTATADHAVIEQLMWRARLDAI
jgi:hypothetical protein